MADPFAPMAYSRELIGFLDNLKPEEIDRANTAAEEEERKFLASLTPEQRAQRAALFQSWDEDLR